MISSINLNSDETMEQLKICVEKVQKCGVVATLRQGMEAADGSGREIVLTSQAVDIAENDIYVNLEDGFVYFYIHEVDGNFFDLKKIRSLWDAMVKHNSEENLKGKPSDYFLTIDLIKPELENNMAFYLTMLNPIFAAEDDDQIIFVGLALEKNRFGFGIDSVSLVDVEYQEELEKEAQAYKYEEEEEDQYEDDDVLGGTNVSEDLLSNDEFTDYMNQ